MDRGMKIAEAVSQGELDNLPDGPAARARRRRARPETCDGARILKNAIFRFPRRTRRLRSSANLEARYFGKVARKLGAAREVTLPQSRITKSDRGLPQRVRVLFNGVPVQTARAQGPDRRRLPPAYYFPRADVRMDLLRATAHRTYCPFRGNASHFTVTAGESQRREFGLELRGSRTRRAAIKGYVAFYAGAHGRDLRRSRYGTRRRLPCPQPRPRTRFSAGLMRQATPRTFGARPRRAVRAGSCRCAGSRLAHVAVDPHAAPAARQHELHLGRQRQGRPAEHGHARDAARPALPRQPVKAIYDGAGGFRRRLDVANHSSTSRSCTTCVAQGATDYVVMPFVFSSGQINAFSLSTKRPGGFSVADLGAIYEVLPLLSRIFEVHAMRLNAVNLLDVYLGKQSGAKVLDGLLRRGDGEDVHAVIWFSDLRNSTRLADSMPRRKFLALLDEFFDCTAGAVLEQGGEVLRFIGDASLAIFPISEADAEASQIAQQAARACESALSAALEAQRRMQEANARRTQGGESRLDLGVGLHVGDVMYGNIGTRRPARVQCDRCRGERGRTDRSDVQDARRFRRSSRPRSPATSRAVALARAPCAAWCCRAAGALHPRALKRRPSARRRGEIRLGRWHGKRLPPETPAASFPFRIPRAHRCNAPGLPLCVVRALALVQCEVEQELVAFDRQVFPFARAHRLLAAEFMRQKRSRSDDASGCASVGSRLTPSSGYEGSRPRPRLRETLPSSPSSDRLFAVVPPARTRAGQRTMYGTRIPPRADPSSCRRAATCRRSARRRCRW
jgi:class 3 adenylate cyclase/uncharacterized protein (DUF427 family)